MANLLLLAAACETATNWPEAVMFIGLVFDMFFGIDAIVWAINHG